MKLPHRISGESSALLRISMVHMLSGAIPLYIVNEYPKSGGTWVGQMLGRALRVPFPRNLFPVLRPSIMHGHYLRPWGMKNVVVVWRDGRDVMVSWYYQNLFSHEWRNDLQVERARREFSFRNYDDIYENLPEFIEWAFTQKRSSPRLSWTDPRFSWTDFVRRWYHRKEVVHVRYEDLRRETVGGLQRIVLELTGSHLRPEKASAIVEEFSFQRQAGRRPGEEDRRSFLRKGVVGDWRNQFSKGARERFDRYAGKELVLLGYEQNSSWTEDTEEKYVANPDASGPA